MSDTYKNVSVATGDGSQIATGADATISDDSSSGSVWGGSWSDKPKTNQSYLLSAGGLLDWTGAFNGEGHGSEDSPYTFTVDESERARRKARSAT